MVSVQIGRIRSGTWGSWFLESHGHVHFLVVVKDWQPVLQSIRHINPTPNQKLDGRMEFIKCAVRWMMEFIAAPPLLSREPCIVQERRVVPGWEAPLRRQAVVAMGYWEQLQ